MKRSIRPMRFNPGQEMQSREIELRYCLDADSPTVEFHAHPFYELYLFCEGDLQSYVVGSRSYQLKRGDILLIPPAVMHHPIFQQDAHQYKRYVLWLSDDFLKNIVALDPDMDYAMRLCREREEYMGRCATPALAQTLENYLQTIWFEMQGEALCRTACAHYACINFLVQLNRTISDKNIVSGIHGHKSPLLDKLVTYIHENYASPITLQGTAEHFFVSPSTVEHLFTQKLGKSFYRYVIECRIITAQSLILSGVPLKTVSRSCGYPDYSNFYKAFTREVGVSPSEFRTFAPPNHFHLPPLD